MATDAQSLLAQAACYQCYASSDYNALLLKLGLLRQLVLAANPMADTSPQTLLAQANCYQCYASSPYMLLLMELALLAQIAAGGGGGGGGGGQVLIYTTTDPTTDGILPADQTQPAVAYKRDGTGPTFVWNTVGLAWV